MPTVWRRRYSSPDVSSSVDACLGVVGLKAGAQVEGVVLRIGAGERGNLHTEARDGLHAVVEFHMFLHHLCDRHVAGDAHLSGCGVTEREL